ncbi:FtsX-like permease family protein [uncultured Desulfovibrio sp.]|uniref:ABC transporter permease n=1 Tax=uncultured Desulfovibrio sp. TaxID=167968 RepID=UPI00260D3193|nr:FtsX-like permease family protein [uncultured Desulfovibrio sp.]
MRLALQSLRLAAADYCHERLLSLCAVLTLTAVLTPLLILYGVKFGVVQTLTDRLQHDPRTLEISPVGSGRFTPDYLAQLRQHPSAAFVLPRTRAIAATIDLFARDGTRLTVSLEPSAAGDPLLGRYGAAIPTLMLDSGLHGAAPDTPRRILWSGVVLSASVAEKLGVGVGDELEGRVERRYQGAVQRARLPLRVTAILPLAAEQKNLIFAPLEVAEAAEDFRDGRAVPLFGADRGWTGEPRPDAPREYAGFRLHARSLDDVMILREAFAARGLEVYTQAEAIAQVRQLSASLNLIFSLIGAAAGVGFLTSTASSMLAAVARKERLLGLLRLMGFSTGSLLLFPLAQSLFTAFLGTGLACGLYLLAAQVVNHLFASSLSGLESVCRLLPVHYAATLLIVAGLSLLAALGPALRAGRIEPSEVIREI